MARELTGYGRKRAQGLVPYNYPISTAAYARGAFRNWPERTDCEALFRADAIALAKAARSRHVFTEPYKVVKLHKMEMNDE